MGLLSFFQRKNGSGASAAAPQDAASIVAARRRARRRLVGAVVLVLAGVIGFPLLFDTAPRPLPVDIPIEIPRKDNAPPLVDDPSKRSAKGDVVPAEPQASTSAQPAAPQAKAADQRDDKPAEPVVGKSTEKSEEKPAAAKPEPTPDVPSPARKPAADEAARAQAMLEGNPSAEARPESKPQPAAVKPADPAGRFVVQVGAFSEAESARDARARVEKLGFKTYTQSIDTSAGKRIRVRVGPYNDRAEAEKVVAKMKQAGIAAAVRTP